MEDAIEEKSFILDSLPAPELPPSNSDPSYSPPQYTVLIIHPTVNPPVRGIPVNMALPPSSHARGPSPDYEPTEDGSAADDDEPAAAATTGDEQDSSTSEFPVANLTGAFTQVSESGTLIPQASPFSATGS